MLRRLWIALLELADGLTRPTNGSCVGDPVAWERDARRRIRESQQP